MSYDDHEKCRRCGGPDDGHSRDVCDRRAAMLSLAALAAPVIPTPQELIPRINAVAKVSEHVANIIARLRAKPHDAITVRDAPAIVDELRARFAATGWSCIVMKGGARDGGVTDALTISAPTDKS